MKAIKVLMLSMLFALATSSGHAGFFGTKITSVHHGSGDYFEIATNNNHFQGCGFFNMGKFESTDNDAVARAYAAALAAMAAQLDVVIWYDDSQPCSIDFIFVSKP